MTRFETLTPDWLTVHEARARILAAATPLEPTTVPLGEALGRALAEPVAATLTLPPWANSAMDGYAVHGSDIESASEATPRALTVVGEVRAGSLPDRPVEPGEAIRIMTGAPVPEGADSVVRVEDTDAEVTPGRLHVLRSRDAGRNVRPAGGDMQVGEVVLSAGTTVGSGQIGVLAALGCAQVPVRRRPVVGVLPNGDELLPLDRFDEMASGRFIPETNGHTLVAAAWESGARARHLGIALDTEASIERHLRAAVDSEVDVLVTVAGASMGETDLFKRVMDRLGFTLDFWRVKMRPGSPVSFGFLDRGGRPPLPVFGLPGNPASAFVTFQVLVRPFLLALAGHHRVLSPEISALSESTLRSTSDLTHFYRVTLESGAEGIRARLTGSQSSGLVRSLGLAQGLAVVPGGAPVVQPRDPVQVMLLQPGPAWSTEAESPTDGP